jgi:hypothetical protein
MGCHVTFRGKKLAAELRRLLTAGDKASTLPRTEKPFTGGLSCVS